MRAMVTLKDDGRRAGLSLDDSNVRSCTGQPRVNVPGNPPPPYHAALLRGGDDDALGHLRDVSVAGSRRDVNPVVVCVAITSHVPTFD